MTVPFDEMVMIPWYFSFHIFTSIIKKGGQKNGYHHDSAIVCSLHSPIKGQC